jgi:hypothetical protein
VRYGINDGISDGKEERSWHDAPDRDRRREQADSWSASPSSASATVRARS